MECPCCGCSEVIIDKIGTCEQSICPECGTVLSDQTFEDDPSTFYGAHSSSTGALSTGASFSMRAIKRDHDRSEIFYSAIGIEEIKTVCRVLNVGDAVKEEATSLLNKISEESSFGDIRRKSKEFKEILGACCVYVILRKHQYPITAKEVAALRRHKLNHFVVMLRKLKNCMKVDFPVWSVGELTAHTLKKCNFDKDTIVRTQQIMQICDKCWLVTGRRPESIIVTAAYFSWLSLQKTDSDVKNVTFKVFCQKHGLSVPKADGILSRMKNILIEMAKNIPWILNFKISNLRFYIGDIIKFKGSLMRKAFSNLESSNTDTDKEAVGLLPFKRQKTENESDEPESRDSDKIDAEILSQYGDKLDSSVLDPSEFEDEMNEYLKTENEIKHAEILSQLKTFSEK